MNGFKIPPHLFPHSNITLFRKFMVLHKIGLHRSNDDCFSTTLSIPDYKLSIQIINW